MNKTLKCCLGLGLVLLFAQNLSAQLHDAQWVLSSFVSVVDFRNDTLVNYRIHKWMNIFLTSANICDENGELLYYTNGVFIADKNGDTVQNGAGLNPCPYTSSASNSGLGIPQGALFLPKPGDSRYYYLFHFSNDTLNDARPKTLRYTIIDKQGNFGLGEVVQKNVPFCESVFREGGMTACKHANGRDWWIVMGQRNSNSYYKFLLTPDSLLGPFIQQIGPPSLGNSDIASGRFSQDGSKYATVTGESLVLVTDFDRCTGTFSNPLNIYNNSSYDPVHHPNSGGCGLEFSPNGRFLYVANIYNLTQYDLFSANIQDSVEIYKADSNDFAQMNFIQLAPSGRMYGSCWNGGFYFLHVINNPDEKGDSCDFVYGGQLTLTDNSYNLPNMVNYKLGTLPGSACDTIYNDLKPIYTQTTSLKVFPNPANDEVQFDYNWIEWERSAECRLLIADLSGRIVMEQSIPKYSTRQSFSVKQLAAGTYLVSLRSGSRGVDSRVLATCKLVKQ